MKRVWKIYFALLQYHQYVTANFGNVLNKSDRGKNLSFKFAILFLLAVPLISNAHKLDKTENIISTPETISFDFTEAHKRDARRISATLRNNVSAHVGLFDPWVGVYYERLITPFWGIDIAAGLIGGSVGTKIYIPRISAGKVSFYTGISEGLLLSVGTKHYIPVGLTFIGNRGLRISFDLGPQIYHDSGEENQFGLTLKLGKLF